MKQAFWLTGILAVLLTGCGPKGEQIMIRNPQGAVYSQGYGDGCASGRHDVGRLEITPRKDLRFYRQNAQYKKGWDTGYKECAFREKKIRERTG